MVIFIIIISNNLIQQVKMSDKLINHPIKDILNKLTRCLNEDLNTLQKNGLNKNVTKRDSRKLFAGYLVSVATHSIGLRASIAPFNCSQEQMLAYLMDMFNLKESQLRKILTGNDNDDKRINSSVMKRTHSWRPELRIRLNAPAFFYNEQDHIDNLSVRVYMFKDPRLSNLDAYDNKPSTFSDSSDSSRNNGLLEIFKMFRLDSSILIRPINEMKYLIRFIKTDRDSYKMVHTILGRSENISDDIHLRIRRYCCEPKSVHILRFEFWSNISNTNVSWLDKFRHLARRLVHGGYGQKRNKSTTYMNENQKFYGFINISLTQIPSYAVKKVHSILSLKERRVNNCEVSLEVRNRRILNNDDKDYKPKPKTYDKPRKSSEYYIINHLRLYVNCLLYQAISLNEDTFDRIADSPTNIILDNLLYIPAYTLINQHRLQSNLNQLEDQSLRRVSILTLLLKLDKQNKLDDTIAFKLEHFKIILIMVVQHEYMVAHRVMDDKTLQEVDPFRDDSNVDSSRDIIVDLEITTLVNFIDHFLAYRLKKWFIRSERTIRQNIDVNLERHITLLSLKLFKVIITHFERVRSVNIKLKAVIPGFKNKIEKLLLEIISNEISTRLKSIVDKDKISVISNQGKGILRGRQSRSDDNPWRKLLRDVHLINDDLSLYWSHKGLDDLDGTGRQQIGRKVAELLEKRNLRDLIETKINNFLAS